MLCTFCNNKTKIYNSRSSHGKTQTWRRHRCINCDKKFTTKERIDWTGVTTVQTETDAKPYNRELLLLSLVKASDKLALPNGMLSELTDSVELELQNRGFFKAQIAQSAHITTVATTVLSRYDPNLALQYVNNMYSNKPPLELLKRLLAS